MPLVRGCGKRFRGRYMTVCENVLIPPPKGSNAEPLGYEVCKQQCVMPAIMYPGAADSLTTYPGGPLDRPTRPRYPGGPLR